MTPRRRKLVILLVTVPSKSVANTLADAVIEAKLAACANILGPAKSIYVWKGKKERASEYVLLLKSKKQLTQKLTAFIKKIHPNECPCIVNIKIDGGYAPYLKWVESSLCSA